MGYAKRPPKPISQQRFDKKVFKTNRCWYWVGSTTRGYGHVVHRGKVRYAHRVAYELYNGEAPPADMEVKHSCDTPLCVNPEHLSIGTHAENMREMAVRGRTTHAKLTPEKVRLISQDQRRRDVIAAEHGVSMGSVDLIRARKTWKHVFAGNEGMTGQG